jgi:hypothetical protein
MRKTLFEILASILFFPLISGGYNEIEKHRRKKENGCNSLHPKKKMPLTGALPVSSSRLPLIPMGPYSDKAGDLGLYPKITLSVLRSACLLAQGLFSIKIKNL